MPHNVLNAKQHEREAEIIVDAGQKGAVTIATNMAGRGVDIKLGDGVPDARRPVRARHRAARVAAHRQPAARSLRPPGRPGRDALLPVRRGRRRAAVRRRPDLQDPRPAEGARGRADRALDADEPHRGRAEARRGAQLRDPQERPQVRRRAEHPARRRLRAAPPGAERRGHLRPDPRVDGRDGLEHRRGAHRRVVLRGVGPRRDDGRPARRLSGVVHARRPRRPRVDHEGRPARPRRGRRAARRTRRRRRPSHGSPPT